MHENINILLYTVMAFKLLWGRIYLQFIYLDSAISTSDSASDIDDYASYVLYFNFF